MVRLDYLVREYIKEHFGIVLSRSYIEKILESGAIKFNGEIIKRKGFKFKSEKIKEKLEFNEDLIKAIVNEYVTGRQDDKLASLWDNSEALGRLSVDEDFLNKNVPDLSNDIIFEDDNYIVTYKPPGVLSHPGRGRIREDSMIYRYIKYMKQISKHIPRGGLLHRLDADTQGLLLFAKNMHSYNNVKKQFAEKQVLKIYLAGIDENSKASNRIKRLLTIASHTPYQAIFESLKTDKDLFDYIFNLQSIELSGFIARKRNSKLMTFVEDKRRLKNRHFGQIKDASSILYPGFKLESDSRIFLFVRILTGRTHQIRSQFKYLGLKLIGDRLYSKESSEILNLASVGLSFYGLDGNRRYFVAPFDKISFLPNKSSEN